VKFKFDGDALITGAGLGLGVGADTEGLINWFIAGISVRSRPSALDPLVGALDDGELPDAAAVSPVPPADLLVEDDNVRELVSPEMGAETVVVLL